MTRIPDIKQANDCKIDYNIWQESDENNQSFCPDAGNEDKKVDETYITLFKTVDSFTGIIISHLTAK